MPIIKSTYLAGPMRGYPRYNFDAFEQASKNIEAIGIKVHSPHHEDLALGFDPDRSMEEQGFDLDDCIFRDVQAILKSDAITMLNGWERSAGAMAEFHLAKWAGLETFAYSDGILAPLAVTTELRAIDPYKEKFQENVLEEANRLVHGARQQSYGHPRDDFKISGTIWGAIIPDHKRGEPIEPRHVAMCMIGSKMSRECHAHKRDNPVDIAGYAATLSMLYDE